MSQKKVLKESSVSLVRRVGLEKRIPGIQAKKTLVSRKMEKVKSNEISMYSKTMYTRSWHACIPYDLGV